LSDFYSDPETDELYILSGQDVQLYRYHKNGRFIDQREVPDRTQSFIKLGPQFWFYEGYNNGKYPERLTQTDSALQVMGKYLPMETRTLEASIGPLLTQHRNELVKKIFGKETTTRLRPSYFPFTEPSVEVDVSCFQCGGCGCKLCKGTGWIEVLGAGVVNNKVLEGCGIDTNEYSGFAFGIGIERIAMLKYGINNIKLLFESDLRVLKQIDD